MRKRSWLGVWLLAGLISARVEAVEVRIGYRFQDFDVPTQDSYPSDITTGPLGDLWFTENQQGKIGRLNSDLHIDEFATTSLVSQPGSITTGPDGNVWFTEGNVSAIGRITPDGSVTEFPLPRMFTYGIDIATGPDGNLWFTENTASRGLIETGTIGRMTVNGTVSEFVVNEPPIAITAGPDNALWFTALGSIGRISTNGQSRLFPIGFVDATDLRDITTGPDGALWFTAFGTDFAVARITTDGGQTHFRFLRTLFPTLGILYAGRRTIYGSPIRPAV